jgi:uncharacterized membrane protein (DUF485 family)
MPAAQRRAVEIGDVAAGGDGTGEPQVDWEGLARTPEFRELVARRKAFVLPATTFFLAWYFGFIVLAGYAPDFMGSEFIVDGLTVGYVLALSQFVMVWALGWAYVRRADRVFDPLAARVAQRALEGDLPTADQRQPGAARSRAHSGEVVTQ